ncbi:vacuolar protein sorting/targeting protein PEP1 [Allomyces arbusculus]|nr:vacuolar protein sorting/targeting protein PEP1 [Allomyces arbusculus]
MPTCGSSTVAPTVFTTSRSTRRKQHAFTTMEPAQAPASAPASTTAVRASAPMLTCRAHARSSRTRTGGIAALVATALLAAFIAITTIPITHAGSVTHTVTNLDHAPRQVVTLRDSPAVLLIDEDGTTIRRSADRGKSWAKVDAADRFPARFAALVVHPFAKDTIYALSTAQTHLKSTDAGASWRRFSTPGPLASANLEFHADEPDAILFLVNSRCDARKCHVDAHVTTNAFDTTRLLRTDVAMCKYARSTPHLQLVEPKDVFCIEYKNKQRPKPGALETRLVQSSDYFQHDSVIVDFNGQVAPQDGVLGFAVVEKYLTAAVSPAVPNADLDMYVSLDGKIWALAKFPLFASLRENAYTVLESQPYSLTVDVLTATSSGTLYTSNSNGTYFKAALNNTHHESSGRVDFERVEWMPALMLANTFHPETKFIQSRISWDEGAHWVPLAPPEKDAQGKPYVCADRGLNDCSLHLHSVTSAPGVVGKIFSEKSSPGVLVGVGNVGSHRVEYADADVFVSRDGGVSWTCVMVGAHHYRQLDSGNVLVLVDNERPTDLVKYSVDGGKSWTEYRLPITVRARVLVTDQHSTAASLMLLGSSRQAGGFAIVHVDFEGLFNRKCAEGDMESWRLHVKGECVMGRTMQFNRVKPGAGCLVGRSDVPPPHIVECACEDDDYECDLNYVPTIDGQCVLADGALDPLVPTPCKGKYEGSSGFRKIPGNVCKGGVIKDKAVERECPLVTQVEVYSKSLDAPLDQHLVLSPMVVMMRDQKGNTLRSADNGKTWESGLQGVLMLAVHEHVKTRVYALTNSGEVWYSADAGEKFTKLTVPAPPNMLGKRIFDFHPEEPDWIVFTAAKECSPATDNCHTETYVSHNHGGDWALLDKYTDKCVFSRDLEFRRMDKDMVYCTVFTKQSGSQASPGFELDNTLDLVAYKGNSGGRRTVLLNKVVDYFVVHGYLVAALQLSDRLELRVSLDGIAFSPIQFPPNMHLDSRIFTVLASSPQHLFLDVMRSSPVAEKQGVIFSSNENGTFYSLSLEDSHRGGAAGILVDFFRPAGMTGVAIANQVANADEIRQGRATSKHVRTLISHNDGGRWDRLPSTECDDFCIVHLHDVATAPARMTKSVDSAGGVMVGVGSSAKVGEFLRPYQESDTFVTSDGGRSWRLAAKGPHRAAIVDHGGIIVLAPDTVSRTVTYSFNYGASWESITLDAPMHVTEVTQDPKGEHAVVVLYGRTTNADYRAVTLDFTHWARKCTNDDMTSWTLTGPRGNVCTLGHQIHYPRRKADVKCVVGDLHVETESTPCECDLDDYECDVGFWRNEAGVCVPSGKNPDMPANCPVGEKYIGRSGYRKLSSSTCTKGFDLTHPVERICGVDSPNTPMIYHKQLELPEAVRDIQYSKTGRVALLGQAGHVLVSPNEGKDWVPVQERAVGLFSHPTADAIYIITTDKLIAYSSIVSVIDLPGTVISDIPPLSVHVEEAEWLLFTGRSCTDSSRTSCVIASYFSKNAGKEWHLAMSGVSSCQWARTKDFSMVARTGILCTAGSALYYSDDFYKTRTKVLDNLADVTMSGEYLVGAVKSGVTTELRVSMDAEHASPVQFPANVAGFSEGYTVVPSHRGALFVDVAMHTGEKAAFGRLFKSNLNGTLLTMVHDDTNRNTRGFVDFERIQGIQGLAVLNTVVNKNAVVRGAEPKKVVTVMTYDDTQSWTPLTPPMYDSRGQRTDCTPGQQGCFLHLHSYTERRDPQNVFDARSAPGVFLGVGNVGDALRPYSEGNVYVTRDAGHTWTEAVKGAHQYEFGDHGAILLLVNDEVPTREVRYSVDDGRTFRAESIVPIADGLAGAPVRISLVTTKPDSTSMRFLLVGTREGDHKPVLHFLDFETLNQRKCMFDENDPEKSDFEPWSLSTGECLFGVRTVFYRRKATSTCAIKDGSFLTHSTTLNCACTPKDFECEFGFDRDSEGNCVPSTPIPEPPCDGRTYLVPSGYRKHPLSHCAGGVELAKPREHYCSQGLSGGAIAALVLIPLTVAGGLMFAMQRAGGGRIQLPDFSASRGGLPRFNVQLPDWRFPDLHLPDWVRVPDFIANFRRRFTYVPLQNQGFAAHGTSLMDED